MPFLDLENITYYTLEAPAPYGSRQGGHVIIFMSILLQGVPGLHTQKMVAIGSAVFAVPGNRQTDGQTVNYSKIPDSVSMKILYLFLHCCYKLHQFGHS